MRSPAVQFKSPVQLPALFVALALPILSPGCGSDEPTPTQPGDKRPDNPGTVQVDPADKPVDPRSERSDRIRKLLATLDLRADLIGARDLGKVVSVPPGQQPFSGSCWPMSMNGIDQRWNKSNILAPAEKYAALFLSAADGKQLTSWVQQNHGTGATGLQTYYGICQGWVASALLDRAPAAPILVKKTVKGSRISIDRCTPREKTKKGTTCVEFLKEDLAALLAELYASPNATILGNGCANNMVNFTYDASGKIPQPSMCKNNAATLFVLATNLIGRGRLAFALINPGDGQPVWTQPAFAYQITRYSTVDSKTAAQLVGGPTKMTYDYNPAAKSLRRVTLALTLAAGELPVVAPDQRLTQVKTFDMVLELDAKKTIIGGQWIGAPQAYAYWMPLSPGTSQAPGLNVNYVKALLNLSLAGVPAGQSGMMAMTGKK